MDESKSQRGEGVKMNCKSSYTDLSCRQCGSETPESQEHLEVCMATGYERRGLDMSTKVGQLAFWKRMSMKLNKAWIFLFFVPFSH